MLLLSQKIMKGSHLNMKKTKKSTRSKESSPHDGKQSHKGHGSQAMTSAQVRPPSSPPARGFSRVSLFFPESI